MGAASLSAEGPSAEGPSWVVCSMDADRWRGAGVGGAHAGKASNSPSQTPQAIQRDVKARGMRNIATLDGDGESASSQVSARVARFREAISARRPQTCAKIRKL